jgi:tRNA pseudouridine55 synthase
VTNGILNINKPRGITSFAVVKLVRRLTGVKRVGHAGTLDPIADGVLPVCLGQATRIVEYLVGAPKVYAATLRLGAATDTYDSEGKVTATGDWADVSRESVEAALAEFTGPIRQLPPMYSALKFEGQPLYRYARAGKEAPRAERTVQVYRLELRSFAPPLVELYMEVGRGAYVRSLAHDLGERLGCHAHLEALTRLRTGPFDVEQAVSPEQFEAAVEVGSWEALLQPVDFVLESWYAALLAEEHSRAVRQGRIVVLEAASEGFAKLAPDTVCRAYSASGEFLAVLKYEGKGLWKPEKVFLPF